MTAKVISLVDRLARDRDAARADEDSWAAASNDRAAATESPITVMASYLVSSGDAAGWIEAWQGIAATAATWPGCRSFRPLLDRNDDMYLVVLSEWDTLATYRAFARETAARWPATGPGQTIVPGESHVLYDMPVDASAHAAH